MAKSNARKAILCVNVDDKHVIGEKARKKADLVKDDSRLSIIVLQPALQLAPS